MSKHVKKSIIIISSTMVRPNEDTPNDRLWLSRLDMVLRQPYSHSHVLYIYPNNTQDSTFFDANILKKSLSKVLVPFYPMAGRLTVNENDGRYEIDCNAEGALFIEADSTNTLIDDLGKSDSKKKMFCPTCDYSKGLSSFPLVMVQLTRFKCGGVCMGYSQHHHVADGMSHVHFINSWGRVARGLEISPLPVHDRFSYVAPRDPPQFNFPELHYLQPSSPPMDLSGKATSTIEGTFKLSKNQIDALRQDVTSYQEISSYNISTFTVLAGHVWRTACKARSLKEDQDVKLYILVDGRLSLKLPSGYCGNVILPSVCKAKAGDILNKPLWYTVSKICDTLAKAKEPESFRSAIDYIETQPSLDPLICGNHTTTCPNLFINSWTKFPYKDLDFGWGATNFVRHGGARYEGQSSLVPNENEVGGLLLNIRLFSVHMVSLEKIFYEMLK